MTRTWRTPNPDELDPEKVRALTESIRANGWIGSPLVCFEGRLITGSHRYAAAHALGLSSIPTKDLEAVFAEAGIGDFRSRWEASNHDDQDLFSLILELLPKGVREYYDLPGYLGRVGSP